MKQCAFLSMDDLSAFVHYDYLLEEPLARLGWEVTEVPWRDAGADWNRFELVVIRTPWDYQDDPGLFLEVLERIDASSARLENALELVRWNIDKRYLRDLAERGLPVVPTRWGGPDDTPGREALDGCFEAFGSREIVLKPAVSANADDTFRLDRGRADAQAPELEELFRGRAWMVQPFMEGVVEEGEFSLIYFGDTYSHTLLKTPEANDFRVQEEHGGRLRSVEPEPALRSVADAVVASLQPAPLYSRVDLVRSDRGFELMELELIEPSLYFNMDPDSPERFARCLDAWMQEKPAR